MKFFSRLFGGTAREGSVRVPQIFLYNTLTSRKEIFSPLKAGVVSMYTCGPTVYSEQHVGNLRPGVVADTLARTLSSAGYRVRRVINITDVGHLTDDGDGGEDKMTVGAAREKTTPQKIAERYAKLFIENLDELNIDTADIRFPRATDFIREQIALAKTLEEKGFAYRTKEGLYFDTTRFPNYGQLGNLAGASLKSGARVPIDDEKKHPNDFALWRAAKPKDSQQWDSPWGRGNPGWHLECSAMIRALLGPEIDVHTGGEDLAQIHHNDEIAQSEAASGRQFVRYWLHNAFLTMNGEKISKSLGNVVYLREVIDKGLDPLALRYFFLQAHYRTPVSFSWEALAAAGGALERLRKTVTSIAEESGRSVSSSSARERFLGAMRDDLATPQALGILWDSLKSEEYAPEEKWGLILDAEAHLGLGLIDAPTSEVEAPAEVKELLARREAARAAKDFALADQIRGEIENRGYRVEDRGEGAVLTKRGQW